MTLSLEREPRGFACADERLDRGYLDAIVRRRSVRIAALFLKCFRRRLVASAVGLEAIVESVGDEPFEMIWSSALGQLRQALMTTPHDEQRALVAATSIALHLAEKGRAVRFEVVLEEPQTFRFGAHLLPAARRLTFSSTGRTAECVAENVACCFSLAGSMWEASSPESAPLVVLHTPGTPVLLLRCLPGGDELPEGLAACALEHDETRHAYEAAYDVLTDGAPSYLAWVHRAVHSLVPVVSRPGATVSASFELHPGIVALSHQSPEVAMADALVHEASHQHFYILGQLGRVDDGSDTQLYYSPARKADRPIDKILLAYHAFANVLLFYRECRSHGVGDPEFCELQEREYQRCLEALQRPLHTTRALTPLGRALFEPLAARLA